MKNSFKDWSQSSNNEEWHFTRVWTICAPPPPNIFLKLSNWDGAFAFKWGWLGHYTNMYKYISETVNKCSGRQSRNTDRNVTERDDFDGWYSETVFCQLFPKWVKDRWIGEEGNPFSKSEIKCMSSNEWHYGYAKFLAWKELRIFQAKNSVYP